MTFRNVIILIRSVINKNKNSYYGNIFFLKRSLAYFKCYISIEFTFLKELMLIRQTNQKSEIFVTIVIF